MGTPERHTGRVDRCARPFLPVAAAVAMALTLVACGGSGSSSSASHSTSSNTAQVGTTTSQSVSATSSSHQSASTSSAAAAHHHATHHRAAAAAASAPATSTATTAAATTTIPATPYSPKYVGATPTSCLGAAGLNRVRAAHEQGVWEGNMGLSSELNRNAIVFLSGPYKSPAAASAYAQSLKVVEISASGGLWVASASLPSHLDAQVRTAATCMAGKR